MKIGIDWDGTISADERTFAAIACLFMDAGHEVKVVTWRPPYEGNGEWPDIGGGHWPDMQKVFDSWGFNLPVVYCDGRAKRSMYEADIWIDDNPAAIVFSLDTPPRFCENVSDYDNDNLVLESPGFPDVNVKWAQLKPIGHLLSSPVNFKEVSNA